jgi:hypothetical protein
VLPSTGGLADGNLIYGWRFFVLVFLIAMVVVVVVVLKIKKL